MYTRGEASRIRQRFWTSFGQYMRPVNGAAGEPVNWLNYKTGIKHLYFRMDAGRSEASIGIELHHRDPEQRQQVFEQFRQLQEMFESVAGKDWQWQWQVDSEEGRAISRIGAELKEVNIFREGDWPAIISFLKPRIIALDEFWTQVKDFFEGT